MMRKFYYRAAEGNFGDDLNEWLWDEVLPRAWDDKSELHFAGIGTILSPWMPCHRNWVICGSGTGYGRPPIDFSAPSVFVAAVRGPLTARALGLPPTAALTDGAILLAGLERFKPLPPHDRSGTIFVPHRSAFSAGAWDHVCALAGVTMIDPRGPCEAVIQSIRHARLVLADSMHAAIIADALRVPWVAVTTSPEINQFKWLDWALSVGVPYEPIPLPASAGGEWWRSTYIGFSQRASRQPTQVERAIESYHRGIGDQKRPIGWRGKMIYTGPQRLARLANNLAKTDRRFVDRAAQALSRVASMSGILSDASRSNELLVRFQGVIKDIGQYSKRFESRSRA